MSDAMNEAVRRILEGGQPVCPVLDQVHAAIAEAARRKGARIGPRADLAASPGGRPDRTPPS